MGRRRRRGWRGGAGRGGRSEAYLSQPIEGVAVFHWGLIVQDACQAA